MVTIENERYIRVYNILMEESKSLSYLPLISAVSFTSEVPTNRLFQLIFSLTENNKLKPLPDLRNIVSDIVTELKKLKAENRLSQISGICNKNDKLKILSKILRQDYFKFCEWQEVTDSAERKEEIMNMKPPQLSRQNSSLMTMRRLTTKPLSGNLQLSNSFPLQDLIGYEQYYLKIETIKLFYHLLLNQKMLNYLNNIHVPLFIYIIILGEEQSQEEKDKNFKEKPFVVRRQVEKALKFVYQYVKISKGYVPKIYGYLIKNLLLEYYPCLQDIRFSYSHKIKRINLCLDFIFQIGILILKKNLTLAAECGLLSTFYHKCLQGVLPLSKVELITDIIVNHCIEEKSRKIIHFSIDLDKTFAIFTNVDKTDLRQEAPAIDLQSRLSLALIKNKESVEACSAMIEIFLSNWPTLLFFLQQGRTLSNFIFSLKRKEQRQLQIIQQTIFTRIVMRCLNYNRKKLIKSNNIFIIQSNYLILRSLILLHHFDQMPEFRNLIYKDNRMPKFREYLIDVMMDYFSVREEDVNDSELNHQLTGNIKYINYLKYNTASPKFFKVQDECINNNIESFCSDSLLSFEFNYKELKEYLLTFTKIVKEEEIVGRAGQLLSTLEGNQSKLQPLRLQDIYNFYQIAQESCRYIEWTANCLDISKYTSNTMGYLLQMCDGQKKIQIADICRTRLMEVFHTDKANYYQYLYINLLDDVGRYFASDASIISKIKPNISKIEYAYKISRILLHIDTGLSTNVSTGSQEEVVYGEICRQGSKALILQIIQIIKYSFQQNDNVFRSDHLNNIFSLITSEDEDIVYSIIQFSEEYIHKSKDLESYIREIDLDKIRMWKQRINYLFLYYQSTIIKIQKSNPTLLKEELELWRLGNQKSRKKLYYNFLHLQLKKFAMNSIQFGDYLNLNFDPNNYRKLIFLPWNIKINGGFYPIFIEYKNLEDKLKLKIFLNLENFKQIRIEELYIGAHIYTDYIRPKATLDNEDNSTLKLTLDEIRKDYNQNMAKTDVFSISKGQIIFFIRHDQGSFKVDRININIPLTLDTYRPLLHPINFINLLCRTRYGFNFLKNQKFIEHCLEAITHEEEEQKYKDQLKQKFVYSRGALVSIGTLCASAFMESKEKIDIYNLLSGKYEKTRNYEIQEIYLWILNILIKDPKIRTIKNNFQLIETKKCGWVCLPLVNTLHAEVYPRQERIAEKIKLIKKNLPEKPVPWQRCLTKDELIYRYFYSLLHDDISLIQHQDKQSIYEELSKGSVGRNVIQNVIRYISTIDFKPQRIKVVMNKLSIYFVLGFDDQFFQNKNDNDNVLNLP